MDDRDHTEQSPLAHIRHRPGMYIGGTDSRAMARLVLMMVTDLAALAAAGKCQQVQVRLLPNNTVMTHIDGPGDLSMAHEAWDSLDILSSVTIPAAQGYVYTWAVVNALSSDFSIELRRDGAVVQQAFQRGVAVGPAARLRDLEDGEAAGVKVTCSLDAAIFVDGANISYPDVYVHLRELAFLVPGWRISLEDARQPHIPGAVFCYENGLADFIRYLNRDCESVHPVIARTYEVDFRQPACEAASYTIKIDFAFQFTDCSKPFQLCYSSYHENMDGGLPVDELRRGIYDALRDLAEQEQQVVESRGNTFFRGLTAVIHVQHPDPHYAGSKLNGLINIDLNVIYPLVYQAVVGSGLPLPDVLARASTRHIPDKQRRFGEMAADL